MTINEFEFQKTGFPYKVDYVTDQEGHIKSIVLDYSTYKKIEEVLLDYGLAKAIEETADEDTVDLETAKRLTGYDK